MSFFKQIDLLGKPVSWQIEGRDSFTTTIGGSIFIYLGMIVLTWYFGKDIYERDNPKFIAKVSIFL